jgi:hypothetical protein
VNTFADANAAKAALDRARSLVTESAPDSSLVDRIQRVDVTVDDGEGRVGYIRRGPRQARRPIGEFICIFVCAIRVTSCVLFTGRHRAEQSFICLPRT